MELALSRRSFVKGAGAIGIGSLVSVTAACPAWVGNVYSQILKYVPVGLQAFMSIISILSGSGVIPIGTGAAIDAIVALVKAAFADVQTDVTNYENAPAAAKATLLGKISTALTILEGNLQQFWNDLSIPDAKLSSLIEGLLGVILSTLAAFSSQLPAPVMTAQLEATQKKRATLSKTITATPQKMSVKQFKKMFNEKLGTEYAQYAIR